MKICLLLDKINMWYNKSLLWCHESQKSVLKVRKVKLLTGQLPINIVCLNFIKNALFYIKKWVGKNSPSTMYNTNTSIIWCGINAIYHWTMPVAMHQIRSIIVFNELCVWFMMNEPKHIVNQFDDGVEYNRTG